ncbi:MAG: metalloregulator ArsR/SmtB family transcription factor [Candidatus Omnitrophota bacterium]
MPDTKYKNIAEMLKIIAHPCRLRIIELLRGKEMQVTQVQEQVHCKQSVTSQHLIKMKNKGVLKARRKGNAVFYSIANNDVLKILRCLNNCPHPKRRDKCLKS